MAEETTATEPTAAEPQEETQTGAQPQEPEAASAEPESGSPAVPPPSSSLLETEEQKAGEPEQADEGAPEKYEPFTVDGQQIEVENAQEFADMAKELGLSQEKAQKVMDAMVPAARNYLMKDLSAKAQAWAEATKQDPEIGGANFEANRGIAMAAYKQYTTPELRTILTGSGLGNHPEVIRLFYRIGKSMQQDNGVAGDGTSPAQPRRRYPKSNMVVG